MFTKQRLLLVMLAVLAAVLCTGCTASLVNNPGQGQGTIALHTPALSPTPTAPPFTIGAFTSNPSPGVSGSITVYVIFHYGGKPQGGATVSLYFHNYNGGGIDQLQGQGGGKQTADDGWAAFPLTYTGLASQTPVQVDATVQYNGQTYQQRNATFFTPLQGSPTAGAGG